MTPAPPLPLSPPKREEEEELELDALDHLPPVSLIPANFSDDDHLPWITNEVIQRSKEHEQELEACRLLEQELDDIQLEHGIQASLHEPIYVGSGSDSD